MAREPSLRVIAGSLKGRRLKVPDWEGLRPTSDRLRETLFNILAPRLPGARVIDVYAGTGALGIEALSRGAASVTFVERDRRAQTLIAENLARCGVTTGYVILPAAAGRALTSLQEHAYDLVLLDPPYALDGDELEGSVTAAGRLLAAGGMVVLERARRTSPPDVAGGLTRARDVLSGDSALTFYEPSDRP